MKRFAIATWKGTGKEGRGHLSTQSLILSKTQYNWGSRFENEKGTNPEELIAAAHASCFTMKLNVILAELGFKPETIKTKSEITIKGGIITHSHLIVKANVPDMPNHKFEECVTVAKDTCPVSRALFLSITLEASLVENVDSLTI